MRRRTWIIIGIGLVAALLFLVLRPRYARIDDVAVPHAMNPEGFRIVAVDGATETRDAGVVITMLPVVLVKAGPHTFQIRSRDRQTVEEFNATVDADKLYRIQWSDGTASLVEYER